MSEWISVKDRLPEGKVFFRCLVCIDGFNSAHLTMFNTLTKWMPLPEPPNSNPLT